MKTIKLFGKTVPIFLLIGILCAGGMGSAALLTYYGITTTTVTVEQSVTTDMPSILEYAIYGGETKTDGPYNLVNHANVPVTVKFATTHTLGGIPDETGITTTYRGVVELTKKNTETWEPIGDKITITYTIVGDTFEYSGVPEGYTLIYYKDKVVGLAGRLNNPQPAITVTSSIGSLPQSGDANMDELANYCGEPDFYQHCKGAKLWVVLTSDITGSNLNWANMANYYYETDLIEYNTEGQITLYPKENLDFTIVNDFNVALTPGTYKITTDVLPVA